MWIFISFSFFLLKNYCVASSSPPLSPEGPNSLVSTIYFIRLHARSYVTPLILRATKPGADDLENPGQRVFFCLFLFLSILGLLLDLFFLCVGFFFSATISIGSHRHSTHRRHEMLPGFVIGTVVALYLQFSPAQVGRCTLRWNFTLRSKMRGLLVFPTLPPPLLLLHWNHRDFGLRFSHAARFILCLLCPPVTQQSSK